MLPTPSISQQQQQQQVFSRPIPTTPLPAQGISINPILNKTRGHKRAPDGSSKPDQPTLDYPNIANRSIHPLKPKRTNHSHITTPHIENEPILSMTSMRLSIISPATSPIKRQRTVSASSGVSVEIKGFVIDSEVDSEGEGDELDKSVKRWKSDNIPRTMFPSPLQKSYTSVSRVYDLDPPVPPVFGSGMVVKSQAQAQQVGVECTGLDGKHWAARRVLDEERNNGAKGEGVGVELDKVFQMVYGRGKGVMGFAGGRKGRGSGLRHHLEESGGAGQGRMDMDD